MRVPHSIEMKGKIIFSLLGLSLILLLLFHSPLLGKAGRYLAPEKVEEAEAVVLGNSGSIEKEVLLTAFGLLKRVKATQLVIVQHQSRKESLPLRSKLAPLVLSREIESLGIKKDQFHILEVPSDHPITLTEAKIVLTHLSKEGVQKVVLISKGFHTRRSYWAYRQIGMSFGIKIFPYPYFIKFEKHTWWQHKRGIHHFITESLKFFYYVFKGSNSR
jgi:uncharacterized SAM-binding protein YcdF (DUF218 family)